MTDPTQSFVTTLQGKQQLVRTQKQGVLNRVAAAKQRVFNFAPTVIPSYNNVSVPSYDDVVTPTYDNIYTEETSPVALPPVVNQEGNVREHSDGTFSVIEDSGFIQPLKDEQSARSYGAYTTADDEARKQGAPKRGSIEDVANRLGQGLVGIIGSGYKGVIGTGTLRDEIDGYNRRAASPQINYAEEQFPGKITNITKEDENRFANVNELSPVEQRLYLASPKFKLLTELKNKAIETKAELDVAEENIASANETIPVDRTVEAARAAEFKYVAEAEGLWEATKHTLGNDWASYLYGGVDAIPYMVILATGNAPVIASVVISMAAGNNVDNTQEFLRLNNGNEPTKDEASRILAFSAAQAAVDAIGDRLAVVGLPKGIANALSTQLISAKKILASTTKSIPSVLNNFVTRTALKVATLPVKTAITEGSAGAAEAASQQLAVSGEITDTAAIVQSAIQEAFAAPVGAVGARTAIGTGKAALGVGKRIVGKGNKDAERKERPTDPTYNDADFNTLLDSVVYVDGDNDNNFNTFKKLGKGTVLTAKQEKAYKVKLAKFSVKIDGEVDNPKSIEGEGLNSIGNAANENVTDEDLNNYEKSLTEISDKKYAQTLSKVRATSKRAAASINSVAKNIRQGTEKRFKGADTLFEKIQTLVNEMVSAPDPGLKYAEIQTEINNLQTHSGNLEKKEKAFKEAESYVVDKSKNVPDSTELDLNDEIKIGENGEVKPRVGTGDSGSAIVIGTTKNRSTTYTVYYNQSKAEIKDANKEHPDFVTEVTLLKTGKSSISNLINAVTADNEYVDAVSTAATAYLDSNIYKNTTNKIEKLKSDKIEAATIAAMPINTSVSEATTDEIATLNEESDVTVVNAELSTDEASVAAQQLTSQSTEVASPIGEESAQVSTEANVTDTDSQTTLTEETSTEESPVTSQKEKELQAQINTLTAELAELQEKKKTEAAQQETAPVDTAPVTEESTTEEEVTDTTETVSEVADTTTTPTATTETIHGVNITYTEVDDNSMLSLAINNSKQGISIRKNITVDSVISYLSGNHVQGDKAKQARVDVKNEVTAKINEEYGVDFLEVLKELSDTEIRNFILLHEYRHTLQRDKRNTNKEFIADYNADKVTFEKDANVYALRKMQLLPSKPSVTEESTVDATNVDTAQESSEVSYKLEDSNSSLLESELDVHTLSVLFPAAINADGTLKTGDTANKAINKLGKFLKVCE
jgi:hypothetical protein